MFGTDHACYTNSHCDTMWSSAVGNIITEFSVLLPLCTSMLPCIVRRECAAACFKSSNENCGLLHKWHATSPQWTACNQLTINTPFHSLRRESGTSLFCSRRKSKDETLAASQNWGHNMRAAHVFNISPASDCTHRAQFSLAMTALCICSAPFIYLNQNRHLFPQVVNYLGHRV